MAPFSHAFSIAIVFHSCLDKVLIDGRQNCKAGIEACIEKHLVRLDLVGTTIAVSQCSRPPKLTYFNTLRQKVLPGSFDGSTVKVSASTAHDQQRHPLEPWNAIHYLYPSFDLCL